MSIENDISNADCRVASFTLAPDGPDADIRKAIIEAIHGKLSRQPSRYHVALSAFEETPEDEMGVNVRMLLRCKVLPGALPTKDDQVFGFKDRMKYEGSYAYPTRVEGMLMVPENVTQAAREMGDQVGFGKEVTMAKVCIVDRANRHVYMGDIMNLRSTHDKKGLVSGFRIWNSAIEFESQSRNGPKSIQVFDPVPCNRLVFSQKIQNNGREKEMFWGVSVKPEKEDENAPNDKFLATMQIGLILDLELVRKLQEKGSGVDICGPTRKQGMIDSKTLGVFEEEQVVAKGVTRSMGRSRGGGARVESVAKMIHTTVEREAGPTEEARFSKTSATVRVAFKYISEPEREPATDDNEQQLLAHIGGMRGMSAKRPRSFE